MRLSAMTTIFELLPASRLARDRCLEHVAMVWLHDLVDRVRRRARAVGERRRSLRGRNVHQRVGHGALRLPVPAPRTLAGRQIVSKQWMDLARTPGPANPNYGFANWYLNTDGKPLPNAPASAVRFVGNGANIIYNDWEYDLVVVVRWIKDEAALNEFLGRVIGALNDTK